MHTVRDERLLHGGGARAFEHRGGAARLLARLRAQVVVEGDRTRRARLPPHERLDLCVVRVEDGGVVIVVDVLPGVIDHAEAVAIQREARAPRVLDVDGGRRRVDAKELTVGASQVSPCADTARARERAWHALALVVHDRPGRGVAREASRKQRAAHHPSHPARTDHRQHGAFGKGIYRTILHGQGVCSWVER